MRNLLDGLEEGGLDFSHVVSSTLYFDDRADYDKLNDIYNLYFPERPPARTTVQQLKPIERKPRPGRALAYPRANVADWAKAIEPDAQS